jgi:hypothetical protein
MLLTLFPHRKFCGTRTDPATGTKSTRAAGRRAAGSVFCSPFRKFIMTSNFAPSTGTHTQAAFALTSGISPICRDWQKTLPAPTRSSTNQTRRRYSAFAARDRPQIDLDKRTITPVHFNNLNLYHVTNTASETISKSMSNGTIS